MAPSSSCGAVGGVGYRDRTIERPSNREAISVSDSAWTTADTESVLCCVCGVAGTTVYAVPPFGVVRCPICDLVFVSDDEL